jgi:hypothetical protein
MNSPVFIHKVSTNERIHNEKLLKQFEACFDEHVNMAKLESILHPNGRFFGNLNCIRAMSHLRQLARGKHGVGQRFYREINYGIATDHRIGEIVIELRFSDFDPFTDNECPSYHFGDPADKRFNEVVFHFAFSFREGKIFSMRIPRSYMKSIDWLAARN